MEIELNQLEASVNTLAKRYQQLKEENYQLHQQITALETRNQQLQQRTAAASERLFQLLSALPEESAV